mgnify:CR=1 FL=1
MSLQGAIEWIQDQALTISGVGAAPDNPTELASEVLLWVTAYPSGGEILAAASGWGYDLDTIKIQILTPRGDLKESMQRLEGFPHNLARLIQADTTLGGNVTTYDSITYEFVPIPWSGLDFIGYRMTINRVKTLTTH